jgi:hypothetical protein
MRGENHPKRAELRDARERAIKRLTDAFVKDELTLEEYEQRVDGAYRCQSAEELMPLLSDLSPVPVGTETPLAVVDVGESTALVAPSAALATTGAPRSTSRTLAVLGNVERRGHFRLEPGHSVLSVLGNVELDLRQVALPAGITTLHVRAVLGNVDIVVPPDLFVECDGKGILGNFGNLTHLPPEGPGDRATLRIIGSAILGSVEIRTRPHVLPDPKRLLP